MTKHDPQTIVHEAVEAHGGAEMWSGLVALEADISARGFLFTAKRRPTLNHAHVWASTRDPRFTFIDYPKPGRNGELIGQDEVRIVGSDGNIITRREAPRAAFRGLRRHFCWDDLDFIYFGGYATWNYLLIPFLFLRKGFHFETLPTIKDMNNDGVSLRVTFPDELPTHCKSQIFYFDEQWLLRRLDYTAEVVGQWARAAHTCQAYRNFHGLKAPTYRRVTPILWRDRPLPGPTLVELEIHEIRPIRKTAM